MTQMQLHHQNAHPSTGDSSWSSLWTIWELIFFWGGQLSWSERVSSPASVYSLSCRAEAPQKIFQVSVFPDLFTFEVSCAILSLLGMFLYRGNPHTTWCCIGYPPISPVIRSTIVQHIIYSLNILPPINHLAISVVSHHSIEMLCVTLWYHLFL